MWLNRGMHPPLPFGEFNEHIRTFRRPSRHRNEYGVLDELMRWVPLPMWHRCHMHPPMPFDDLERYMASFG